MSQPLSIHTEETVMVDTSPRQYDQAIPEELNDSEISDSKPVKKQRS